MAWIKTNLSLDFLLNKSSARIKTLDPIVQEYAKQLIVNCWKDGISIVIVQANRTMEEQQKLYNQGRTTPGSIVTNAKPGSSFHNYGNALDACILNEDGKNVTWEDTTPRWERVIQIGQSLGFVSGSTFRSIKDYPHFEFTQGKPLSYFQKGGKLTPTGFKAQLPSGNVAKSSTQVETIVSKATLEKGDRGDLVKKLQSDLVQLGFKLTVDGSYGDQTIAAVKQVQRWYGLLEDGVCGSKTLSAIEDNLKKIKTQQNKTVTIKEVIDVMEKLKYEPWMKQMGEDALASLNKDGIVSEPAKWKQYLDQEVPGWLFWSMIDALNKKKANK